MDDRFADWYSAVDPSPSEETLQKRWDVIERIASRADVDFTLDLVRLYSGMPPRDVATTTPFVGVFKRADPTLSIRNTDELARVLAGATLVAILGVEDFVADAAALAVASSRFAGHGPNPVNADLEEVVDAYLAARSNVVRSNDPKARLRNATQFASRIRKIQFPELEELGQMSSYTQHTEYNQSATRIQHYAASLSTALQALRELMADFAHGDASAAGAGTLDQFPEWKAAQEELNILWWLYGESSRDLGAPAQALEPESFALIAGKELADLTTSVPGVLAAPAMLRRALRATGKPLDTPISLCNLVESAPPDWLRRAITANDAPADTLGVIAPMHLAVRRSLTDGVAWNAAFCGTMRLAEDPEIESPAGALQFYTERLLGRAVRAAGSAPRKAKWTINREAAGE